MDEMYFPIEVILNDKETKIFESPEDIPHGVGFKVLRTNVNVPKILNTGMSKTWPTSTAD